MLCHYCARLTISGKDEAAFASHAPDCAWVRHTKTNWKNWPSPIKIYKLGNLSVVCDREQVFPNDPGAGTPAMVHHKNGACSTLWCAMGEGELLSSKGSYRLTDKQIQWLEDIEPKVTDFLYTERVGCL